MNIPRPADFQSCIETVLESTHDVRGWAEEKEIEFLTLLAAFPTAHGEILEIGGHEGRLTIALANGARFCDTSRSNTDSDPRPSLSWMPQDPDSRITSVDFRCTNKLVSNLQLWGVRDRVAVTQCDSRRIVQQWHRPLRLLVHDGASDSATVQWELAKLRPFLSDGAIVVLPGLFDPSGDKIRCFVDELLHDEQASACGVVGSTGWVQLASDESRRNQHQRQRDLLIAHLSPLTDFHRRMPLMKWKDRVMYRWHQAHVSRRLPKPTEWVRQVA